jgi:sigma-B regulation protein RsbU (phosphoserine phosphatase)
MQDQNSPTGPRFFSLIRERVPTGLAGAAVWLGLWFCVLFVRRWIPGGFGTFLGVLQFFVGIALISVVIPLTFQLVRKHLLWSLRNKLVLT